MKSPSVPRSAHRLVTFAAALVLLVTAASVFVYVNARAATAYTWNQTGTASWATAANWTPARTTPAADDVLVFNNGATTTVTNVPTQTVGQLSVSGNTNVTLQAAVTGNTLTVGGDTGTDVTVAAGSQLNVNTALALNLNLAAGTTGSVSGSMTLSAGAHRLTAVDASAITFNSGASFTSGTGFSGNPFGTTNLNSVVFANGSTFVFIAGSNPFGATQPNSVVVFQSGSLYKQQSTNAPAFSGRTYANFEMNVAGTVSPNGGAAVSLDNLTVTLGTLNFGMTGTPGHAIKGNISVASGATLNFNPASVGTVNFNGASAQTITNSGTFSTVANQTFVVANANGVTVNSPVTFAGPTTVNSGATLAAGATLTTNGAVVVNGNLQINQSGFYTGTGTYTYDQTNAALVFNNTSGSFGVSGTPVFWPTTNGPQNVNVKGAGGITMNVVRTVGLLFQYAAGISGAGNLTLNGTSQVNPGGFTSGSPTYGSSSLLKYNVNSSYGRNGEWLPNVTSGAGYPANVQLSNNTNLDLPNGSSNALFQMSGNLTIDSGSTMNLNGSPAMTQPLNVLGNVNNNGTLALSTALGGDLKLQGSFNNNATFTPNNRAVFFEGANMQSITALSGAVSIPYVVINKSGSTVALNNTDLTTLAPGGGASINFVGGNSTLTLNGRLLTLGSSLGNTPAGSGFIGDASARMSLQDGGAAGSMGTLTFVSGGQSLQNLTVNRTGIAGTVILGSNLNVGSTLALTAGQLITNTNTLTVAGAVTRTTGYIIGNLRQPYSAISTKTFDVGTANGYSPVVLDVSSGTFPTEVTVKAVQGQLPQITGTNALQRYWTISASTPVLISMTVNYLATDVVGSTANYAFIRKNGSTLDKIAPNGQAGATSASVGNVAPFSISDWTLAEPSAVFGTFQLSAANYDTPEGDSSTHNVTVMVQRTGGSSGAVSVHYATSDGTANNGSDYAATSGDLNWTDGETADKSFNVTVNGDTAVEPDETVNLTLSAPTGNAALGSPAGATVTIQNDDAATSLSGTKTVCASGCDYANLTGTSGLFAAVNTSGLAGDLTAEISSDLTEDGTNALNQWTESGAGGYTLTIRPADGTARLISGSVAAGMIRFNGADRVTFDGRSGGAGRFLTFRNTNPSGSTFRLSNDTSGNTIRNSVIEGAANTAGNGVILFATGTATGNDDNTVTDNQIRDRSDAVGVPFNLILSAGTAGAAANSNNTVSDNELFNFLNRGVNVSGVVAGSSDSWTVTGNNIYQTATRPGSLFGISVGASGSNTISGNTIHDLTASGPIVRGINLVTTDTGTTNVSGNRIYALSNTSDGTETTGVVVSAQNTSTVNVFDNMLSLVPSGSQDQQVAGLYEQGVAGTTVTFLYNSVLVGGTSTGTTASWACVRGSASGAAATWRNNICFNDRTGGGANNFAGGNQTASGSFSSDYNIFVGTGGTNAADFMDYGTNDTGTPVSFATWQSSTGGDANSSASNPGGNYTVANIFTTASDLHLNLAGTNPASNAATPLASVTNDYDDETRDTVIPDIGADEFASPVKLQLSPTAYSVGEGGGSVTITVTRTDSSAGAVSVQYSTSDGTAAAGSDYAAASDTLNWADGDLSDKTFTINIDDDTVYEGDETFNVTLGPPITNPFSHTKGRAIATATSGGAIVTINDNDSPPTITTVSIGQDETDSGVSNVGYTVTKTGATALDATVEFQTADGTATSGASCAPGVDYVSNSGTLTFLPAETTKLITIEVCGDTDFEPDETYTLTLNSPTNATLPPGTGVYNGQIANDDEEPPPPAIVYVDDDWAGTTGGTDPDGDGPATNFGYDAFSTVQGGVNGVAVGGTVNVYAGTYDEDVNVNKAGLSLLGTDGAGSTNLRGPIGGAGTTVQISASNVTVAGFTVTRLGNNTTDWNNPGLNSAGFAIQGQAISGAVIRDNVIKGNRTGIDLNNSNGHTFRNNVIDFNRTGLIFRNQTDNLSVVENFITNNWTVGVLFLDGSGGTDSPVQRARHSTFSNNSISANWYGQVVDRQAGGSLPAPDTTNLKNFHGNWWGTTSPVVTTANSAEPGYAAQIPVAYGGSATPPGGQPDIAGPASANIRHLPLLLSGTDTNVETTPGRGTNGFQGVPNTIVVSPTNQQGWVFFDDLPGTGTGTGGFEEGPATPPLGAGSAFLQVDAQGRHALGTAGYGGTRMDDVAGLNYYSYQDNNTNTVVAPSLQFDIDYDLNDASNTFMGRLVFEPYLSHAQGAVQQNVWQPWDARAGNWYGTRTTVTVNNTAGVTQPCQPATPCTWQQVIALFPNAGVRNTPTSLLLFKVGGPWAPGFDGNVDGLSISVNAAETDYDFEALPQLSISNVSLAEGNAGTTNFEFNVTLSRAADVPVTVDYATANGTASAGTDYAAVTTTQLTFNPGETSKQLSVQVNGDTSFEPDENFFVNLSNASNAALADAQGEGTIQNDDPTVFFSIDDVSLAEGNAGTTAFTFTVTKTGAGAASVDFATQDVTAADDSDYASNSGTLSFASADTAKTVTVLVNGDTTPEADETFFVLLSNASGASISDDTGTGTIGNDEESVSAGQLIISEFRLRGPGPSAPEAAPSRPGTSAPCGSSSKPSTTVAGGARKQPRAHVLKSAPLDPDTSPEANDEFIELYNATDSPLLVTTTDGSEGWAVAASDGLVRFIIPTGTIIPPRSHFLSPNLLGYSLGVVALGDFVIRGDGTTCFGYELDIPDNAGIALFRTSNTTNFSLSTRLDAAGSTAESNALYREGAGYPALAPLDIAANLEHSFYRSLCTFVVGVGCTTPGVPKDSGNNAADFLFVDTEGTLTAAGQRLGAPGPENLASNVQSNGHFSLQPLDRSQAAAAPPNRVRSFTPDLPNNSTFGTLSVRRRVTNNTGAGVTALRFRIVELTSAPAPTGTADLRARDSADIVVTGVNDSEPCAGAAPCDVDVRGTTLEQKPTQPNGGGYNSSLGVSTITLSTPLAPGESVNVQFLLGIQQTGTFRFLLNIEAVTSGPTTAPAAPAARPR